MGSAKGQRRCIATGNVLPQTELIRFVRAPDGTVVPDLKHKLPGRGVWVRATLAAIEAAGSQKAFDRGFKDKCLVAGDLAQLVQRLIEGRALGYLALANKAGLVVQGFEKTWAALAAEKLCVLIGATDGADDGRGKLKQKATSHSWNVKVVEIFDSSQLSLALGRTNVIHAGLIQGGLARKFVDCADSVASFVANDPEDATARVVKERA